MDVESKKGELGGSVICDMCGRGKIASYLFSAKKIVQLGEYMYIDTNTYINWIKLVNYESARCN
jgi:hypothetical protein